METIKKWVGNIDLSSQTTKLGISFAFIFACVLILSPGVFFEIDPLDKEQKIKKNKKVSFATAALHSLCITFIVFIFVYFYIIKKSIKVNTE